MSAIPVGFQSRCFGVHFSGGSRKSCDTSSGVQTLQSSGGSWVVSSLLVLCHCTGWGLWWDCVPLTHLDVGGLVHLMCMSCSVSFQISFEGNWCVCSYRFSVSVRDGFRILLCCHFEAEKHFSVCYNKYCITNILVGMDNDIMWEKMNISDWIEKWFRMLDSVRSFKNTLTDLFSSYFSLSVCTRTRYNDPCLVKYKGLFY